jgi:hypothetical protein
MHRIDYDGYVEEGGLRRFIDEVIPGTPGTILGAEWMNAVQEEILGCLTAAGITPRNSSVTDRAGGWGQLATALFSSRKLGEAALEADCITTDKLRDLAVTDDKIFGLDLAKVSGEISTATTPSAGVLDQWVERTDYVARDRITVATGHDLAIRDALSSASRYCQDYLPGVAGYNKAVRMSPAGLSYMEDPDNTGGPVFTAAYKMVDISLGVTGWVDSTVFAGAKAKEITTRIPKSRSIFSAQAVSIEEAPSAPYDGQMYRFKNGGTYGAGTFSTSSWPVLEILFFREAASPFWKISATAASEPLSSTDVKVHVVYAGE